MAYNSKYTGEQVEALLDKAGKIPSKTSDLLNDSGFLTEHQRIKTINGIGLVGEGDVTIESNGGEYDISSVYNKVYAVTEGVNVEITQEEYDGVAAACAAGKTLYYYGTQGEKVRTLQYIVFSDGGNCEIHIEERLLFSSRYFGSYIIVISKSNSEYAAFYVEDIAYIPDTSKYATYSYLDNFALKSSLDNYAKTSEVESMIAAVPSPHRTVVVENSETIGFGTSNYANIPSIELAADKFYIIGRSSGLEITLPNGSDTDGKEYVCQFYVGSNYGSYTLTLPDTVAWLNGEAPTFESTTCYMLSIVNHCAVIGVFRQAS